jgi:SAM-dependent methyltransferase
MSELTEYTETKDAIQYDLTRKAQSMDIIKQYITNIPATNNQVIMDIGCGTGNHILEMDKLVSNVQFVGIEKSPAMILHCNKKINEKFDGLVPESLIITDRGNTVTLLPREIADENPVPFIADIIISCQVLHHLGGEPGAVKLLTEASKCSKLGSKLIINWTPPEQIASFWYLQHMPELIGDFNNRTVAICRLVFIAEAFGWEVELVKAHNGKEETLQDYETYRNFRSVLDEEVRKGDSMFSLLSPSKLDEFLEMIRKMDDQEGQKMFNILDTHRQVLGQSTTIVFNRKKNVDKLKNLVIKNFE